MTNSDDVGRQIFRIEEVPRELCNFKFHLNRPQGRCEASMTTNQ